MESEAEGKGAKLVGREIERVKENKERIYIFVLGNTSKRYREKGWFFFSLDWSILRREGGRVREKLIEKLAEGRMREKKERKEEERLKGNMRWGKRNE